MDKLGSRKFWMAVIIMVVIFVYMWFGKISEITGLGFIGGTLGSYLFANVAQKIGLKDATA